MCKTIFSIFLILAAVFNLNAQQQNKKAQKLPEHIKKIANIEFAKEGDKSLQLDLYLPKNSTEKVPVIMWVHGGGWLKGSRTKAKGLWLVEHGYAIASISYRLTTEAIWPAQINDCRSAVRFLRSNAEKYGLNGDKIAAWGGSAGGHLVAVLGTQDLPNDEKVSSRVQAVLDWYGPSDLLSMPPNNVSEKRTIEQVRNSNGAKLLGATVRDVPDLAKEASGFWNVSKDDPPFLIMHGEKDPGVPLEQSTKFHEKLKAAGVSSELFIVKGAGHGGKLFLTEECNKVILTFFDKVLKGKM
ncbi:MAG: alpha/beta hydrolase [Lentisphaeraceae bacterium]|nr:alpha/beta hydrolase [Lentisphaeraceae bacterium]